MSAASPTADDAGYLRSVGRDIHFLRDDHERIGALLRRACLRSDIQAERPDVCAMEGRDTRRHHP